MAYILKNVSPCKKFTKKDFFDMQNNSNGQSNLPNIKNFIDRTSFKNIIKLKTPRKDVHKETKPIFMDLPSWWA